MIKFFMCLILISINTQAFVLKINTTGEDYYGNKMPTLKPFLSIKRNRKFTFYPHCFYPNKKK